MNRTIAAIITALILLFTTCCCCCGDADWEKFFTPTLEATPAITRGPAGDAGAETEQLPETTGVPARDLYDLAVRLQGLLPIRREP